MAGIDENRVWDLGGARPLKPSPFLSL